MRTLIYRLFFLAGIVLSMVGVVGEKAEASEPDREVAIQQLKERPIVFSDLIDESQSNIIAYHYSHSSHLSHASHYSHRSHYSSRW